MKDYGTTPAQEWYLEFVGAVVRQVPRDIKETTASWWVHNQEALKTVLREALLPPDGEIIPKVSRIASSFTISCKGTFKASELVERGEYNWASSWMIDEYFPLPVRDEPLTRVIELVEFYHNPTSEEVLDGLRRLGLERPTPEDALYFGIDHPDKQRKRSPIAFLHEPVRDPDGHLRILVLDDDVDGPCLRPDYFDDIRWPRIYLFAGVRQ